jgi:putative ABC transport system permease protein
MSLWRQLSHGIRVLAHRDAADHDVADEVEHYVEQATTAGIARGLSPDAARRAAQLEVGNLTAVREEVRTYGWENLVGTTVADIRYATRRLANSPGFTVVAIVTLALRIGASAAIFSTVNPILFTALPYPEASRVVMMSDLGTNGSPVDVTFGTYVELAARAHAFGELAVANAWQPALTGSGGAEPERLQGQQISGDYFRVLGVPPAIGRGFEAAEDRVGGPRVAIVSDRLARRRAGDSRTLVGQAIVLNGDPYTVIGVMPASFENVVAPRADVWAPLQYNRSASFQTREWGHHLQMVGRLKSGVTLDQARREVAAIGQSRLAEFARPPWANLAGGLIITSLQEAMARDVKPVLLAIVGGVLLLLAIAAVNVTNLLLARGALRRGEIAVRTALGAGRTRLVRQVLTESLVLAVLGGALGVFLAQAGVRALVLLAPPGLPRLSAIRLDGAVFVFAVLLVTCIGVIVGLIPALQVARADPAAGLQQSSRRTAGGHHATRGVLVVTEIALALVLLTGAGLLWRSISRLLSVAPGFDASHLLSMQVGASGHRYDADSARYQFFQQARDAVLRVPGVTAAAFTSQLPLSGDFETYGVQFETHPDPTPDDAPAAFRYVVTPGYFQAMHIPLRRGRLFDAHDDRSAAEVVIVNESYARRVFGDRDPIGQRVRAGPEIGNATRPWGVIVGVVGDVKQASLAVAQQDAFYVPMGQWIWVDNVQSLVVRTSVDAKTLAPAIRNAIWSVDREPITRVATMDDLLTASEASRHFALVVFEAFALTALALAAIGIYGILSGSVTERTREIGVRSALGASRGDILGLIVRQGMVLTGLGVVIGVAGAVAASRAVATLLFGVSRFDPVTYLGVVGLLVGVSGLACWLPAWRAAKVDPVITLRTE